MKSKKASPAPIPDSLVSDSGKLKVFISWSGPRSKHIALALHKWLPKVIQALEIFMSSEDIRKGGRGLAEISRELELSSVGIVCLTPENQTEPWMLFESGALSKLGNSRLCTFLLELEPSDVKNPLGLFQHTRINKEETLAMLISIDGVLGSRGLGKLQLTEQFEILWPTLEKQLAAIPVATMQKPPERTDTDKIDELLSIVRDIARKGGEPRRDRWDDVVFSALEQKVPSDVRLRLVLQWLAAINTRPWTLDKIFSLLKEEGKRLEVIEASATIREKPDEKEGW